MQYCVAANYYWLLVEGVYLYTLLAFSVFSEQCVFKLYLSIGWGKAYCRSPPHLHGYPQQGVEPSLERNKSFFLIDASTLIWPNIPLPDP